MKHHWPVSYPIRCNTGTACNTILEGIINDNGYYGNNVSMGMIFSKGTVWCIHIVVGFYLLYMYHMYKNVAKRVFVQLYVLACILD